jgi:hypothetical protein
MKPVKIVLAFALVVMGCSSDPGPNEPQTYVAGRRPNPGNGNGGDDQVAQQVPGSGGDKIQAQPNSTPVPVPWEPPGTPPNVPVPAAGADQNDNAQPMDLGDDGDGDHRHKWNEAVGETLHKRN